jgi:hypothetical protein
VLEAEGAESIDGVTSAVFALVGFGDSVYLARILFVGMVLAIPPIGSTVVLNVYIFEPDMAIVFARLSVEANVAKVFT